MPIKVVRRDRRNFNIIHSEAGKIGGNIAQYSGNSPKIYASVGDDARLSFRRLVAEPRRAKQTAGRLK
jgi:hypothetical protein